jgi:uncharacterized lipoprotein YddW (UPF0748 family)
MNKNRIGFKSFRRGMAILLPSLALAASLILVTYAVSQQGPRAYLPVVARPEPTPTSTPTPTPTPRPDPPMVEFRGLWVSRFDWTLNASDIRPGKIDEIVNNAAYAGFNVIFFQVRGTADAFYDSTVEPWSDRLTGTLGQNPGWDPLARLITKAHERGIQVHAYLNVYPVWTGCSPPPNHTDPLHLYYKVLNEYGQTGIKPNGLQWTSGGNVVCSPYQRTSPASGFVDNHLLSVTNDLITNYDIDGIHLDHIRYAGSNTSYDPISTGSYDPSYTYADWQRRQVNGTVGKFYDQIVDFKEGLWLSAAVWPIYVDYWGWGGLQGYSYYYQDSKAWIQDGYIDSISPMIYPSTFNCPDNSFWSQSRWQTLVENFQADSGGRYVIPGIGTGYCDFAEIKARINMARAIGTAGHSLFSYSSLLSHGYFDDLAQGPYAEPAVVPEIGWHR